MGSDGLVHVPVDDESLENICNNFQNMLADMGVRESLQDQVVLDHLQ